MKAKITKKDGTVIELEGTAAELGPIIDPPKLPPLVDGRAPQCPGIGDTSGIGKMIDELMKGPKETPYQPTWPIQPIDPGFWQWPRIVYNDMCSSGGPHDYPTVWNGIFPPPCSKCGRGSGVAPYVSVLCTNEGLSAMTTTLQESSRIPFISAFTIVSPAPQS